jgi:uncharacterized damage-inducible protein DinB
LRYLVSALAVSAAFSLVCFAQQTAGGQGSKPAPTPTPQLKDYPSSRIEGWVMEWTRARDYTKDYLDAMPADGYSLKPTPEIRSFAEQMLHLAAANFSFAVRFTGQTNPYQGKNLEKMEEIKNKEGVTKVVLESYNLMIAGLKTLADAKLDEKLPLVGMNRPRSVALAEAFEHQTHHRGQTTIYLRLKGVTPPEENLFSK